MMYENLRSALCKVFPRIAQLRDSKNPAGLLGVFLSMTEEGLLAWTVVMDTGLMKITAADVSGCLSVTLTRANNKFRSPIEIELHYLSGAVAGSKFERFVVDPGNFAFPHGEIWRRASEIFTELRRSAVESLVSKRERPVAD